MSNECNGREVELQQVDFSQILLHVNSFLRIMWRRNCVEHIFTESSISNAEFNKSFYEKKRLKHQQWFETAWNNSFSHQKKFSIIIP